MRLRPLPHGMRAIDRALRAHRPVLDIHALGPGVRRRLGTAYLAGAAVKLVHVPRPERVTLLGLERDATAMLANRHGAMAIVQTRDGWYALVPLLAGRHGFAGAFDPDTVGFNGSLAVRAVAGLGVRVAAVVGNSAHGAFTIEPRALIG